MVYELRWNPLLRWWVMVASSRQNRPLLPVKKCPFCPGSDKVPQQYKMLIYNNDFPILQPQPPEITKSENILYCRAPAYGKCEVVLYTSDHNCQFWQLSIDHLTELIGLWTERYLKLGEEPYIKYVFIFENRGEVVGVTIHHPHGQIYGYPFIPKRIELELDACRQHWTTTGFCLHCQYNKEEKRSAERVVYENNSFLVYVPYFAEYPYQVWVVAKRHCTALPELNPPERKDLALTLQTITRAYDNLFGIPFPYMMCFHQRPTDGNEYNYYHFHIEFYPPLRNQYTQKYNASSETGAWVNGNPTSPEEKAAELRQIIQTKKS